MNNLAGLRSTDAGALFNSALRSATAIVTAWTFVFLPTLVRAQAAGDRSDPGVDADDARTQALLGTYNLATPEPYGNLYATAPGAGAQASRAQFRVNVIAPINFDSNVEEVSSAGARSWGTFPSGNVSWAAPAADLPLRITASVNSEFRRFSDAPNADVNRLTISGRLQYVDPTNDQAFSPYFAVTPRFSYLPAFSEQTEARQDFNFGFNKRFNFNGALEPVAIGPNTSTETVWSFGLTAFVQRRLRQPQLSSSAVALVPSISWLISKDWNANFAVEFLGRWYDADLLGRTSRDWEALPIATLEYVIPASLFGGGNRADLLGRPAVDFQVSHLKVWSSVLGAGFYQWEASAALKMGWRF